MLEPFSATFIIIAFLVIWGIVIPVCGGIPKIKEIISLRYLIITVFLACMIGVIINFSGLDTSVRMSVIIGTAILAGVFIVVRSLEKAAFHGWLGKKEIKAEVKKGDVSASVEFKDNDK